VGKLAAVLFPGAHVHHRQIHITGRRLALADETRLNAVVSDPALISVGHDAGKLLALLSAPGYGIHLAPGVVVLSPEPGVHVIAARARVGNDDALVFMAPDEFFDARPPSGPAEVAVSLAREDRAPIAVGWQPSDA
jgi:hypothetical protein